MTTIDEKILDWNFDEESGFGEPKAKAVARWTPGETISTALVALGAIMAAIVWTPVGASIQLGDGVTLTGSWLGLLASYGLLIVGSTWLINTQFAGTQAGIKHDGSFFTVTQARGWIAWILGVSITVFYVLLYFQGELAPYIGTPLVYACSSLDPLSKLLSNHAADRWFVYGFLYTACVIVFGIRMFWKYRHNRYQLVRTSSVIFFQLGLAFLVPGFLKAMEQPEYYFTYFWPLKPNYALPGGVNYYTSKYDIGIYLILFSAAMTLIATPTLTYFFGKRWYCSWVCGCGGLAETLGDPWRQQSSKSTKAWHIERWLIHSVLVAILVTTALLWLNELLEDSDFSAFHFEFSIIVWKVYSIVIVSMFSGVIGVGFYPLLGSRVWCRFGCPMAAILGLLQRYFSRFRITTNGDQCMSCGNCSTYCEMGIDVRAYAQKGENIVRASCVGCGVCSAVCPRGVLKLENGAMSDRYDGAADPVSQFIDDLMTPPRP